MDKLDGHALKEIEDKHYARIKQCIECMEAVKKGNKVDIKTLKICTDEVQRLKED